MTPPSGCIRSVQSSHSVRLSRMMNSWSNWLNRHDSWSCRLWQKKPLYGSLPSVPEPQRTKGRNPGLSDGSFGLFDSATQDELPPEDSPAMAVDHGHKEPRSSLSQSMRVWLSHASMPSLSSAATIHFKHACQSSMECPMGTSTFFVHVCGQ